jgi:TolB-like protein/tetratricopeptide (TPR) repeat protein
VSALTRLVHELRRRRVFRMTGIYIVAAWVGVQVASETFPAIGIPESAIGYVWVAALLVFPLAVFFSWKYDVTAEGIRRTAVLGEDDAADHSLKRIDYAVLSALILILLLTVSGVGQRLVEVRSDVALAPSTRAINPNSIAVLPLENLSPDPEDAYFAAGIHDALITSLSKINALMVTSGQSARRVNKGLSVPEIGRQLGVAKLLAGSVLLDGDRVRVLVQLIDAASDMNLWVDTYERDVTDIIGLQNEVARTIADIVEIRLTPREEKVLAKRDRIQPDAYRTYLKGMYQFFQDTPEADFRGIRILEEAARQDPTSALAHAGVAYGYANIVHTPSPSPVKDAEVKAKEAAEIALRLDPDLAEAHMALGMYQYMYEWDFEAAQKSFERAIELSPSLTLAHYDLGWLYEALGPDYEEESLAAGRRTVELSPLSAYMVGALAWQYADACRYDEALDLAREAIRLDPEHPMGWASLGLINAELGQFDDAIDAHERLKGTVFEWFIGVTYAAAGLEDKAREVATAWEMYPLAPAWIYMVLGDRESALHWLAESEATRMGWYPWLLGNFPGSENLEDDPWVQARAAALGLPDPRTMGCL